MARLNLLVHTHRCEKLEFEVQENISIMDLKARVENVVGEGKLFRVTDRSGNPGADDEFRLVFHGQVLEDYDATASACRERLAILKKKVPEKECQSKALEAERKQLQAEQAQASQLPADQAEQLQKRIDDVRKRESEAKKDEKSLKELVTNLQKKCLPQKLSAYYAGRGSMLHIVSAKAKNGMYNIRINYLGTTMQTCHCRCERVSAVLKTIRTQHDQQLPRNSDDFKIHDALFWRCAATRMVRLDSDKCLCEYGIEDGSTFEHDIDKVPVSKQAQSQFAGMKRKSKLKSLVGAQAPRRSRSTRGVRSSSTPAPTGSASSAAAEQCRSSAPARNSTSSNASSPEGSSRGSLCSRNLDDFLAEPASGTCSCNSTASTGMCGPSGERSNETQAIPRTIADPPDVRKAVIENDLQGSAPYGPSKNLADLAPDELSLKQREQLAHKGLRQAQKAAAKAEKALKESETKLKKAEAHAARAQSAAYHSDAEIHAARDSQHWAEAALRSKTLAEFKAKKSHNATLPPIETKPIAGPTCVLCLDAVAEVIAYPCGHRCYCDACADSVRGEIADARLHPGSKCGRRCPICRESLENLVHVF